MSLESLHSESADMVDLYRANAEVFLSRRQPCTRDCVQLRLLSAHLLDFARLVSC